MLPGRLLIWLNRPPFGLPWAFDFRLIISAIYITHDTWSSWFQGASEGAHARGYHWSQLAYWTKWPSARVKEAHRWATQLSCLLRDAVNDRKRSPFPVVRFIFEARHAATATCFITISECSVLGFRALQAMLLT